MQNDVSPSHIMSVVFAFILLYLCVSCAHGQAFEEATCFHDISAKDIAYGVRLSGDHDVTRRQTNQPVRIAIFYDSTVDTEIDATTRSRLQNTIIPGVLSFLQSTLSPVLPAGAPLLLERDCTQGIFFLPITEVRRCFFQCEPTTFCGTVQVPEDHLQRCVQCDGLGAASCRTIGTDSQGIANSDYILYVSTSNGSPCGPQSSVLAFAGPCQLESTLDRPFAGFANFCPERLLSQSDEAATVTAIHEVFHALGFSSALYAFFRDEAGNPRTPRDQFGRPPQDADGFFEASENTLRTVTYTDWETRTGLVNHPVTLLVTPNIVEQGRIHYNCSTLIGVEVENQGGGGTAISHWEIRTLGNEGMTGVLQSNARFSRFTLALFQDSGWYRVNYDAAEILAWGQNSGCRFAHGSCGERISTGLASGESIAPFCNRLNVPAIRGCSIDRLNPSFCNMAVFDVIPSEFQYFNSGVNFDSSIADRVGGALTVGDFCPYEQPFSASQCADPNAQPGSNIQAETYGPGSRCVEQGRAWSITTGSTGATSGLVGGGCYRYSCSQGNGVILEVLGNQFQCSCEGEELVISFTIEGTRYDGSLICPSCLQICYDEPSNCSATAPPSCYDRVTMAAPIALCPDPPALVNGMVTFTGNSIGDTATYTCNSGFELIGSATATCGQVNANSAVFSPAPPECRPLCPDPADIVNGMVTFTGNSVGDTATYTCNSGFELIGSATATCVELNANSAAFSPAPPECRPLCPDPADIVNGMVMFTGNSIGDTATYTCNSGFELIGSATASCVQVNANSAMFSSAPPDCRPLCPDPADIVDGIVTFTGNSIGNTATYTCNSGFDLIGSPTATCIQVDANSAVFSPAPPECRSPAALCPDPPAPVNGVVTFTGNSVGDTATYTCNSGFELIGSATATCGQVGANSAVFSPAPPECRPLCPDPADIVNGMVTFTGNSVGDTATYTCNSGFELIGSATATCVQLNANSAAFSPAPPECRPLCPDPADIVNGIVTFTGNSVGDTATYTCNSGFELIGSVTATCMQLNANSAAFSPAPPECRPLCPDPADIVDGMVTFTGNSIGDTATYTCNAGFDLIGSPTATCIQVDANSAVFSPAPPECRPPAALCPDPSAPVNGVVTFTGNSVGDTATYTCNSGFELIGSATATCGQVGANSAVFSPAPPECRPLCPDPTALVNGMVTFTGNSVGDTATYTCNSGFELIGSATATCVQVNANSAVFSPAPPECRPLCPDPADIVNGMVTFTGNSIGDTATYTCNSGFELIGSATATCVQVNVNSAVFSSAPPECRPPAALCPGPPAPVNGMVTFTGNSIGDTATYTCNLGFELIGSTTATCVQVDANSAVFSPAPPECRLPTVEEVGIEQTTYTVSEEVSSQNLALFVCVLASGVQRSFTVTLTSESGTALDGSDFRDTIRNLSFNPLQTRQCTCIEIVQDDAVENSEVFSVRLSTTEPDILLTTPSATVTLSDDGDVVEVGLQQTSYTASEDMGNVVVCISVTSGTVERMVSLTLTTISNTAIAGLDYTPTTQELLITPTNVAMPQCVSIPLLDDDTLEMNENFSVLISTTDDAAQLTTSSAVVVIENDDIDLSLTFTGDTPRVTGNSVTAQFLLGLSIQSVMCGATTRESQNCSQGFVTFTDLPPNRRRQFNLTLEGRGPDGETSTIFRTFRIDTIRDCWLHLINEGITFTGNSVTVEWQGTGPSAENRVTTFMCSLDEGPNEMCSNTFTRSQLQSGFHQLRVRPDDDGCRRRLGRTFSFEIP